MRFSIALFAAFAGIEISYRAYLLTWWGLSLGWSLLVGWLARFRFLKKFRECAADRYDSASVSPPPTKVTVASQTNGHWKLSELFRHRPAPTVLAIVILSVCALALGRKIHRAAREGRGW